MYRAKIGHVHLKVRDLERSVAFYTRVLNMDVTEIVEGHYAFLSGGAAHHEVALQALGPMASQPGPYSVGLYHSAFEVEDKAAFAEVFRTLEGAGVPASPVDHRISWALYFEDPDGNGVEIYVDTRHMPGGAEEWHGASLRLRREDILAHLPQPAASIA